MIKSLYHIILLLCLLALAACASGEKEGRPSELRTFERFSALNGDSVSTHPYEVRAKAVRGMQASHDSLTWYNYLAMALKTYLVAVRTLPAGHTIGYGCTCKLFKDTRVGTIAAGYADGLPLNLSNRGYVLVKGRLCPILGRLSMDYTTISLDSFGEGEVKPGEIVTCIGGEGANRITVEDWAQIKGTHSYDVICSFGTRVERVCVTDH